MPVMTERRQRLIRVLDALKGSFADAAMKPDRGQLHHVSLTMEEVIALRDAATEEKQRLLGR